MKLQNNTAVKNVTAVDHSYEGLGTVKIDDYPIFVENLLPGEIADILIKKANSKFAFAKVIKRYNESTKRIKVVSKKLMESGSAPLANISYSDQLEFKENFVKQLFKRNIHYTDILPILKSDYEWRYRNKLLLFTKNVQNTIKIGLYEKNSHNLIEQDSYDLVSNEAENVLIWLGKNINKYDCFKNVKNALTSITLRESYANKNIMLYFTTSKAFDLSKQFVNDIAKEFDHIETIMVIVNDKVVYSYLSKKPYLIDKIGKFSFKYNWNSFFQINSNQTEKLYSLLLDNLNLDKSKVVLDAYCGIGTISLFLAQKAKKVYGLEIVKEAVINAKENALDNSIHNTEFISGDVIKTIDSINEKIDTVVVDPPRSGLSSEFLNKIIDIKPEEIGYISCNPHTMCRDIDQLIKAGYELSFLRPCDMFSQTYHIEMVAVLKLKEAKRTIKQDH
ncbi:23S rRNA (uracil(1939)-C(5))-methyltransferase RlmD [Mycoplasmopsis agalactiae]|nr:23S rRNA (uracil(1939)-C(5))-methyltransferase RlmD [Mycoplasmopsis agalactiae]MCE6090563.1 23S rRNA (uracil(1939)-C(5))-methyltransferase RlmD [Mycoplasmopsis agalactiae]